MNEVKPGPQIVRPNPQSAIAGHAPRVSLWIRELPYALVFVLTILGVASTSYLKQPITIYWELLAPLIALVCVGAGWHNAGDRSAWLRLIWTQVLHWAAFLMVMNVVMLPSVQRIFSVSTTGLSILTLLALGTFTAGVHVMSWQVCLLGLVMALSLPAIAWIEASALIVVLVIVALLGIGVAITWHWHESRAAKKPGAAL